MEPSRSWLLAAVLALAPALALASFRGGDRAVLPPTEPRPSAAVATGPVGLSADLGRPVLEFLEPEIDQAALRLTFRARNRGQADLPPSALTVRYRVEGVVRGPAQIVAEGSFVVARVAIVSGASTSLGSVALPDRRRALSFEHVTVNLALAVEGPSSVEPSNGSFPVRWRTRTVQLDNEALHRAGEVVFRIRLNGYGSVGVPEPLAVEGGFVALAADGRAAELRFPLPPIRPAPGTAGAPYLVVVNALHGESRGGRAVSIRDGRLTLRTEVVGPAGSGFTLRSVVAGRLDPVATRGLTVTPFWVTATITLGIAQDRAALCIVRTAVDAAPAVPELPAEFAGARPVVLAAVRSLQELIIRQVAVLLATADGRSAIEDLVNRALVARGPVSALHGVESRADSIVVTCL